MLLFNNMLQINIQSTDFKLEVEDIVLLPLQGDSVCRSYPGRCPGLYAYCPFRAHFYGTAMS